MVSAWRSDTNHISARYLVFDDVDDEFWGCPDAPRHECKSQSSCTSGCHFLYDPNDTSQFAGCDCNTIGQGSCDHILISTGHDDCGN